MGNISLRCEKLQGLLDPKALAKLAYPVFVANTPIKSGHARKKTSVSLDEIRASYPYAKRLDQGYSKQSPQGMTDPTVKFLNNYIRKLPGA